MWHGRDARQQRMPVVEHALDRAAFKKVGIIFYATVPTLSTYRHKAGNIELARMMTGLKWTQFQPVQPLVHSNVLLHCKHSLEQRRAAHIALGSQDLN